MTPIHSDGGMPGWLLLQLLQWGVWSVSVHGIFVPQLGTGVL